MKKIGLICLMGFCMVVGGTTSMVINRCESAARSAANFNLLTGLTAAFAGCEAQSAEQPADVHPQRLSRERSDLDNRWMDGQNGGGVAPPEGYEEPAGRVEKLKIEGSVSKYYDENIDLVAFGPGSGWLKLKTRDGISPEISFKRVTQRDVQRFNWFSKSVGLPIRVEFIDSVLRISAADADKGALHLADITEEKIGAKSIMVTGFFKPEKLTRLAIRKDSKGKVFLVKVKKTPGKTPVMAERQKKGEAVIVE